MIKKSMIIAGLMIAATAPPSRAGGRAPSGKSDYLTGVASVAEFRSLAEAAVRDFKSRQAPGSADYEACRTTYSAAEEGMDAYLSQIATSVSSQQRMPDLIRLADQTNRAAESFFACAWRDRPESARLLPIAPLVQFAVVCIETLIGRSRRGALNTVEILKTELAWKPWDLIH